MWYWFNKLTESWVPASNFDKIEDEFNDHLTGNRVGQRVYHCFGDGSTALINFDTMTTCCGSGRCRLTHKSQGLSDDHMSYKLKRE